MNTEQILYNSDDAAKFVTGIEGWVDRQGRFFGNDERAARYSGCTHTKCQECGKPTRKHWTHCDDCRAKRAEERYLKRERKHWDGETPLYSDSADIYFFDEGHLLDHIYEHNCTIESLRLVICKPVKLRQVDEDYWSDDLAEDGELPDEVVGALESLNAAIREADPVAWEPGKYAADCDL